MEDDQGQKISFSIPFGAIAAAVLLGLAAVAYVLSSRQQNGVDTARKPRSGRAFGRRVGLRTLITVIENDTTRKVLVAALKAIARRS